ncbi:MAG: hypothetical protein ACI8UO_003710 [Verrucomicrobiales bacterium]|jgi:hypothetical protein
MNRLVSICASAIILICFQAQSAEPAATVEQITNGPKHHFFGYVGHGGTIPWNASGRYIVALRVDFHDRMPQPDEAAEIILIDTQNDYRVELLDRTLAWNLQQGTMLFWNPDAAETQFLFNDKDPETGVVFTVLYDIAERRRVREFRFGSESIANGGVSPAGKYFAGINYGKITRSREVISYPGATDHTAEENPANPDSDGVFRVETATGDRQLLVSYAQLSDLILTTAKNREKLGDPDKYPIYAHHTMWSRDGEWIFFLVRGKQNKRPDQACAVRFDGSDLRKVPYAGHPEWSEKNELVLASKEHGSYNLYDVAAEKWTGQLGGPGVFPDTMDDNALSPDGSWHVGSQKIGDECFYTFYRLADGHWFRAPPVPTKAGGGVVRIDPAPRWNRAGDTILAPGLAEDGTRQLFLVRKNDPGAVELSSSR